MLFLTGDQYDMLFMQAHNLCCSCSGKDEIEGYIYLDRLLNFTTMITGKYPEEKTILNTWDKARELRDAGSKGGIKDTEVIMKTLIGSFTYDKNRTTQYELLIEDLKSALRQNDALRESLSINLDDITAE